MTRQEAIWHANHVFNLVIERCINAQNLKEAREFDEAKQIVIEALEQQTDEIVRCKDCKYWHEWENGAGSCHRSEIMWVGSDYYDYCSFAVRNGE